MVLDLGFGFWVYKAILKKILKFCVLDYMCVPKFWPYFFGRFFGLGPFNKVLRTQR
jgi:hypothetical protein